jgi:hypothetical protein
MAERGWALTGAATPHRAMNAASGANRQAGRDILWNPE